jgi:hypothetical protein
MEVDMIIRGEFPIAEINLFAVEGDVFRLHERNLDPKDIPLAICFNLGSDFARLTPQMQKGRVLAMQELMKDRVTEVMEDMESLVGAYWPKDIPHKTWGRSGRCWRGGPNIRCHSIESFWSVGRNGGGRSPSQAGRPGSGKRS